MIELLHKIREYTEAGIILNHMELFDELEEIAKVDVFVFPKLGSEEHLKFMEEWGEASSRELDKIIIKTIEES